MTFISFCIHGPQMASLLQTFSGTPYLLERFLTFRDCKYLGSSCKELNHLFFPSWKRIVRMYQLDKRTITMKMTKHLGAIPLQVPFDQITTHFLPFSYMLIIDVPTSNDFHFYLVNRLILTNIDKLLRQCNKPEPQWSIVENETNYFAIEYPRSLELSWQTKDALQALQEVDICCSYGTWYTCTIIRVTDDIIHVRFPWWYHFFPSVQERTLAFPSAYIAPPRSRTPNWRANLHVGSHLTIKLSSNRIHYGRIEREQDGYYIIATQTFKIRVPKELQDTDVFHFGLQASEYIMSDCAGLQLNKLDYNPIVDGYHTRITFYTVTQYDLPSISVIKYY